MNIAYKLFSGLLLVLFFAVSGVFTHAQLAYASGGELTVEEVVSIINLFTALGLIDETKRPAVNRLLESWGIVSYDIAATAYTDPSNQITLSKITLTSPADGARYTLGSPIPIHWTVTNAPEHSQVHFSLTQLTSDGYGSIGGGSGSSLELGRGTVSGSHEWTTGGVGRLDRTGTYKVEAQVRECHPSGCQYNPDFPGRVVDVETYAVARPVIITIAQASDTSITNAQASPWSGSEGERIKFSWIMQNPKGFVRIVLREYGEKDIIVYEGRNTETSKYINWTIDLPSERNVFGGSAYLQVLNDGLQVVQEKHIAALALHGNDAGMAERSVQVTRPSSDMIIEPGTTFHIAWKTENVDPKDYLQFTLREYRGTNEYALGGGYYAANGLSDDVRVQDYVPDGDYYVRVYAYRIGCLPPTFNVLKTSEKGGVSGAPVCTEDEYAYGESEGLVVLVHR